MLKSLVLSFVFIVLNFKCLNSKQLNQDNAKNDLLGVWIYGYSIYGDNNTSIMSIDRHCPTYKMIFSACDDSIELKKMPNYVKELRKSNILKNIKCQTFIDSLTKIDTYFPVITEKEIGFGVGNFGKKYKSSYNIKKLTLDTLIIYDGKRHKIKDKNYYSINHVYLKIR